MPDTLQAGLFFVKTMADCQINCTVRRAPDELEAKGKKKLKDSLEWCVFGFNRVPLIEVVTCCNGGGAISLEIGSPQRICILPGF